MKKNILLSITSFLLVMTADAQAQEQRAEDSSCSDRMNFYVKNFDGANFLQSTTIQGNQSTYQTGYVISGLLGFCWCDYGLRVEAEYAFRRNSIRNIDFITQGSSTDGHFQTSSYMANLLWDLPLCSWGYPFWNIQPFIGAGIGYDHEHMYASNSRIIFDQEWNHFSWQAMAGFAYPICRNLEISLEYKFHQGGSDFNNQAVGIGLVYKFGFIK